MSPARVGNRLRVLASLFASSAVIAALYHNQQRLGGLDALRELRPDNVVRIRRLDFARAGLLPQPAEES